MMYFASRLQAGRMLASQIAHKYDSEECTVVALSDGGVVVGAQIAIGLHAPLSMLLADQIALPRDTRAIAGITQDGSFSYNHALSSGEIDEVVIEYRSLIEQQKLQKLHAMHRSMGQDELIRQDLVEHRNVVLVADGLSGGFAIDLALQYLKPLSIKKVIVATPFASVQAVDRMHVLADDIFCLNVLEDYISTDHYYDAKDVPDHESVLRAVGQIVAQWTPGARNE